MPAWFGSGATAAAAWFRAAVEHQRGRLFLWLPVALGLGAAIYLYLPSELSWPWAVFPSILMAGLLVLARRMRLDGYSTNILMLILFVSLGFAAAKLRTEQVRAPVIDPERSEYVMTAFVIDNISSSQDQPRLLLAPVTINGLPAEKTPIRLRVSLKAGAVEAAGIEPGDAITAFALLNPPPAPSMPDGYDFARTAYFQSVGGVGFIPGRIERVDAARIGLGLKLIMALNRARWHLTQAISHQIAPGFVHNPELGGFAAALVTGHQALVPAALIDTMRDSGLAHILSISGVHMAVVGGFVFFGLRWLMALIPALALRFPIKKLAAAISLVCILLYLSISGMPAPAIRAAIVACVAFAAILFDRQAISLRGLAMAAMAILLTTPEAVIQPGFQMSFAATAALLAVYEIHESEIRELSVPWWVKAIQTSVQGVRLSVVISLVATFATLPLAIAYFNRISVYSLVSNLFEAPITGFIVMPCLAVGTVLAGTPVGWIFLRVSAAGLWLIERVAALTAGLPHAVITWPSAPALVLPAALLGVLWTCLVRGRLRWAGVVVASAILWWPRLPAPDVWIDPQGGNAAVRTAHGAYVLRPKVRQYGFEQWTRHYGLDALDDAERARNYLCKGYGCIPTSENPVKVAFWFSNKPPKPDRLAEMCKSSRLVVLRNPIGEWPQACAGINHISAGDFRRLGALELTRTQNGWAIKAAQPLRGHRYWSSPSDSEDDSF